MSLGLQPESLSHRQKSIVDWVQKNGYASIERMAEQFEVSAQTIRRDVIELSERRILQRHHGGASLPAGFDSLDYNIRQINNAEEKKRIGTSVAKKISDGASIFIDIGTTTEAVAKALINHKGLTPGMLVTLGERKILTLADFADLASDELTGSYDTVKGERVKINGYLEEFALSKNESDELIMSARNKIYKD